MRQKTHTESGTDISTCSCLILKGFLLRGIFFKLFYLARHKISITLVSIECLDHMQSTSQLLNSTFTEVNKSIKDYNSFILGIIDNKITFDTEITKFEISS